MIIVKFSGGLGNQMFQYALLRRLQKDYPNVIIKADISTYKLYDAHYGFELNRVFDLENKKLIEIAGIGEQFRVRGELPLLLSGKIGKKVEILQAWLNARTRAIATKMGKRNVIFEDADRIVEKELEVLDEGKNWFLDGYWQNEIYFSSVLDELKKIFIFPKLTSEYSKELVLKIKNTESVSVHVRRGDYVQSGYDILRMDYYREAISLIREKIEAPVFFFFSDDMLFVSDSFDWIPNKVIVKGNTGKDSFRDMQLMSLCKHNIIANSSFSTWAGYLNQNPDKRVFYPDKYTREYRNTIKKERGWKSIPC